jgi:hypothetical protein
LLTLPVLAVTAAAAVLFETIPVLRGRPGQHRLVLPVDDHRDRRPGASAASQVWS